jgi:L-ascorbate metabolism protein UlaG (beta-lactamase superfamily)
VNIARIAFRFVSALLALAAAGVTLLYFVRPGLDAELAHRYVSAPRPGDLTATWFGVTALLLSDGEHAIFIDPFFTRPPGFLNLARNAKIAPDETLIREWLDRAKVSKLDAVLVSHSHYDHAMDAAVVARLTGARLAGSASTVNIGQGGGLPKASLVTVKPDVPLTFGSFKVTFIESRHAGATGGTPTGDIVAPLVPPVRYLDYRQGGSFSILVEHAQGSLLHHGSAGFVPGALAGRHAGIVFLGIALLPDLEPYLANTVDTVGAKRVIPVHWDDFTRPLSEPLQPFPLVVRLDRFFDKMKQRPDLAVETLAVGQPVALFRN